ncbi:ABC transporter [Paenibacillus baekrokdamisoli]|uniref:ABC transporter n=1 Tax=Paenibacillus baekrokdamisoli TaxID=1712516 RepID=A0A3G9JGC8_9BACL|nr:sugar ABC transporter permease [Paenibacillus baekrokdamisoli]MBB3072953.1 multiple sugar transport system permease protein [Paenibacillus baekrokdamisoli]BBH22029.1 ABC transporter [Paenibacillus baekrokdamisoli]
MMGKIERRENKEFYILTLPWIVIFIAMGLFPLLYGLYLSFTNYSGFNFNSVRFVGLRNYHSVFTDSDAMYSLGRSFIIGFINVIFSTVICFFLALLLNNNFRGIGLYRSLFYLPAILPITAVGLMWKSIFSQSGILNSLLQFLGFHTINWLGYDHATLSLLILLCWGCGGGIIIYLAGLKGISVDLFEAAAIDGANAFQRFKSITVPLMTPVIFFNLVFGIIGSLQIFLQSTVLTSSAILGVPIRPLYLYLIHAFQQIFAFQRYAYGLALLWVLFAITILLTLIVFGTSRLWVHYDSDDRKGR